MHQYESKKTAASTKKTSSCMGKKFASSRRRIFNSSANQHDRQVYENIMQRTPIITLEAPRSEDQYSAGSVRPPINELSLDCADDLSFVEYVLANNWRELISSNQRRNQGIASRAKKILEKWNELLPQFLEHYGFKSRRANQSHTYHRPGSNDTAEQIDRQDEMRTSKIRRLYKGSSGIRRRRKYTANEKIKRYLRHCAAALAINFGIDDEIQCYYDDDDKAVYVATNNNAGSGIFGINGTKISEFSIILQHSWRELIKSPTANVNHPIWGGFHDKLVNMVMSNNMTHPLLDKLEHPISSCPPSLIDATFQVIGNTYGIQGLHAERQILYYLRAQKRKRDMFLNPLRLGGIRRPCFICAALCFADMSQVRPGPVWVSSAASTPRDILEMFLILDAIRNRNYITYVSESDKNLTTSIDTESEGSESEC